MTLIKTSSGIIDITGRVGGDIYKRDASGLHITAKNRYVRKPKTQRQIDQNNWYCAIKRAEAISNRLDYPLGQTMDQPDTPFEKPRDPPGVAVYSMHHMYADRTWAEGFPLPIGICYASLEEPAVRNWIKNYYPQYELESRAINPYWLEYVNTHHPTMAADWNMTNFAVAAVLDRYYEYFKEVLKEPDVVAATHAIDHFEKQVKANTIKYTRVAKPRGWELAMERFGGQVLISVFAGLALFIISAAVYGTYRGWVHFNKRRVLLAIGDITVFGSLLGRPSKKMLDFVVVGPPSFPSFTLEYDPSDVYANETVFDPILSITEVDQHIGYHYVFTWSEIHTRWCREAVMISQDVYRMNADPATIDFFGIPVGYRYPVSDYYDYNTKLAEYWRRLPEVGPLL